MYTGAPDVRDKLGSLSAHAPVAIAVARMIRDLDAIANPLLKP
jgi:hypothetical protein